MIKGKELILLAAKPGPLRESLQALLLMVPKIDTVSQVGDAPSILRAVVEHHPALVLLDTSLSGDKVSTVVKMIKANGSRSRCLVLVDNVQQQQEAESAGADVVLFKGFPAAKLFEVIKGLLSEQKAP
jgi:DNA-binding NarL/FixJ family response regulator